MSAKVENHENETDQFDFEAFDEDLSEDFATEAKIEDPFDFGSEETTPKTNTIQAPPPPSVKTKKPTPLVSSPHSPKIGGAQLAKEAPVQVAALLGKKTLTVGELVDLKKGEVLELDRFPNEAIDLMANGKLLARGDLVEVDGKLGVRIIKIL